MLAGLLGGMLAAALGLGALVLVVITLWITSPYPDDGPAGPLRVAADLWLAAHGAGLVRTDGAGGTTVPVGITPLLLVVLPVWLLHRAGEQSVAHDTGTGTGTGTEADTGTEAGTGTGTEADTGTEAGTGTGTEADTGTGTADADAGLPHSRAPRTAPRTAGRLPRGARRAGRAGDGPPPLRADPTDAVGRVAWLVTGYTLVALAALLHSLTGPLSAEIPDVLVRVPLVAALVAGAGAWKGCGRPPLPNPLRASSGPAERATHAFLPRGGVRVALRAAAAATGTVVAGGALLFCLALVRSAPEAAQSFSRLTGPLPGRIAVLLLAVCLVPNAVVWGACYALGPGFAVGGGGTVSPAAWTGRPDLPLFPLLEALPEPGVPGPAAWAVAVVPVAAAVLLGMTVAGAATGRGAARWRWRQTAAVTVLAALASGAGAALLAGAASGPMGLHALADFGPRWWAAGGAAAAWAAGGGLPVALFLRWWRTPEARVIGRRARRPHR
ncbi:hypothetical protein GCM10010406_47340 [Streptomyces thermolineatus]|uniref:Integral membrane protein n=2 Tax=Streptomyces thermolineatus TaxID=44033 RepID=A0ABP6A2K9_9ACTN